MSDIKFRKARKIQAYTAELFSLQEREELESLPWDIRKTKALKKTE